MDAYWLRLNSTRLNDRHLEWKNQPPMTGQSGSKIRSLWRTLFPIMMLFMGLSSNQGPEGDSQQIKLLNHVNDTLQRQKKWGKMGFKNISNVIQHILSVLSTPLSTVSLWNLCTKRTFLIIKTLMTWYLCHFGYHFWSKQGYLMSANMVCTENWNRSDVIKVFANTCFKILTPQATVGRFSISDEPVSEHWVLASMTLIVMVLLSSALM